MLGKRHLGSPPAQVLPLHGLVPVPAALCGLLAETADEAVPSVRPGGWWCHLGYVFGSQVRLTGDSLVCADAGESLMMCACGPTVDDAGLTKRLKYMPAPTIAEQHAFLDAAKAFDFAKVRALVNDNVAYVNVQPAGRWTAIHHAALHGDHDTIKFLIDKGADLTCKNSDGQMPHELAKDAACRAMLQPPSRESKVAPVSPSRYLDADFPPTQRSISGDTPPASAHEAISWRRFDELWPSERLPPSPSDLAASALSVDQGAVGNCYFLGPLSSLASSKPQLVRWLFVATSEAQAGDLITLRFYVHGEWQTITVDTLFPCRADGRPLFSGRTGPGWAALLEKGYAKLAGSYAALDGGRAVESLVEITGGCCERHSLEPPPPTATGSAAVTAAATASATAAAEMVSTLRRWSTQGHLICCSRVAPLADGVEVPRLGQPGHTYCVLGIERRGKQLAAHLHSMPPATDDGGGGTEDARAVSAGAGKTKPAAAEPGGEGSGSGWVRLDDLPSLFDRFTLCRLPPVPSATAATADAAAAAEQAAALAVLSPRLSLEQQRKQRRQQQLRRQQPQAQELSHERCVWLEAPAGGPSHGGLWAANPQIELRCSRAGRLTICFAQRASTTPRPGAAAASEAAAATDATDATVAGAAAAAAATTTSTFTGRAQFLTLNVLRASRAEGAATRRAWDCDDPALHLASDGPRREREVSVRVGVSAGDTLTIVPNLPLADAARADGGLGITGGDGAAAVGGGAAGGAAGRVGRRPDFVVRVWSDAPCLEPSALRPLPPLRVALSRGFWRAGVNAGGRHPLPSWPLNPQLACRAATDCRALMVLTAEAAELEEEERNGGKEGAAGRGEEEGPEKDGPAEPDDTAEGASEKFDAGRTIGVRVLRAEEVDDSGGNHGESGGGGGGGYGRPSDDDEDTDWDDEEAADAAEERRAWSARHLVLSGIDGNVRSPSGARRACEPHAAYLRDDSDIEANGFATTGRKGRSATATATATSVPTRRRAAAAAPVPDASAASATSAAPLPPLRVHRALRAPPSETVVEAGFAAEAEASALLRLHGGAPLLLVPSMARPPPDDGTALDAAWRLSLLHDGAAPLQLMPVPAGHTALLEREWHGGGRGGSGSNAGGSHLEGSWSTNPQFALRPESGSGSSGVGGAAAPMTARIVLSRPEDKKWAATTRREPVKSMLGIYVFAPAALSAADVGSELVALDDHSITLRHPGRHDARREVRWEHRHLVRGGTVAQLRRAAPGCVVEAVSLHGVRVVDRTGRHLRLPNPPLASAAGPRRADARLQLAGTPKEQTPLLHESCFAPGHAVECTLRLPRLPPGGQLVLMPATFGAAQFGTFSLLVHADRPFTLHELT